MLIRLFVIKLGLIPRTVWLIKFRRAGGPKTLLSKWNDSQTWLFSRVGLCSFLFNYSYVKLDGRVSYRETFNTRWGFLRALPHNLGVRARGSGIFTYQKSLKNVISNAFIQKGMRRKNDVQPLLLLSVLLILIYL